MMDVLMLGLRCSYTIEIQATVVFEVFRVDKIAIVVFDVFRVERYEIGAQNRDLMQCCQ